MWTNGMSKISVPAPIPHTLRRSRCVNDQRLKNLSRRSFKRESTFFYILARRCFQDSPETLEEVNTALYYRKLAIIELQLNEVVTMPQIGITSPDAYMCYQ